MLLGGSNRVYRQHPHCVLSIVKARNYGNDMIFQHDF